MVRGHTGESVVLLSGELPAELTDENLHALLDLAAAILDESEMALFQRCLEAIRVGEIGEARSVEIDGAILMVYQD